MILAAGRGERLRPLTDTCPKPLIPVNGKPLIEYHIENLYQAGIKEIVINVRHLGEKIQAYLGDGQAWDVNITYSNEPKELEVGGGILRALPLLGKEPFLIVNGDIWTDYPLSSLQYEQGLAHLVLVDNPAHNPKGDFCIEDNGILSRRENQRLTYSGISILHPELFEGCIQGDSFRLAPLLDKAITQKALFGEYYDGNWTDVGTIERLQTLEKSLNPSLNQKMNYSQ